MPEIVGFLIPDVRFRLLGRKCCKNGKSICNLTPNNVDIAVAHPNVGGQTGSVILRRTVVKHGRDASPPQHKLCRKTSLKAQGAPRHSLCSGSDCPPNSSHRC